MEGTTVTDVINASALGSDMRMRRRGLDAAGMTAEFDGTQLLAEKSLNDIKDDGLREKVWERRVGSNAQFREAIRRYEVEEVTRGAQEQTRRNLDETAKKDSEYYTFEAGRLKSAYDAACDAARLDAQNRQNAMILAATGGEDRELDFDELDRISEQVNAQYAAAEQRARAEYGGGLNILAAEFMKRGREMYGDHYNATMSLGASEDAAHTAAGGETARRQKEMVSALVEAGYTDFASMLLGDAYLGSPNATKVMVMEQKVGEDGKPVLGDDGRPVLEPKMEKVRTADGGEALVPVYDAGSYNPSGRLWMTVGDVGKMRTALAGRIDADARAAKAAGAQSEMQRINGLSRVQAEIERMFSPVVVKGDDGSERIGNSFDLDGYTKLVGRLTRMRNTAATKSERELADTYLNKARSLYNEHTDHLEHVAAIARSEAARADAKARQEKYDRIRDEDRAERREWRKRMQERTEQNARYTDSVRRANEIKAQMQGEYDSILSDIAASRARGMETVQIPVLGDDGKSTMMEMTPDAATRAVLDAGRTMGLCLGKKYDTMYNAATLAATAPEFWDKVLQDMNVGVPNYQTFISSEGKMDYYLKDMGAAIVEPVSGWFNRGPDAFTDIPIRVTRMPNGRITTGLSSKKISRVLIPVTRTDEKGQPTTSRVEVSVAALEDAIMTCEMYRSTHPSVTPTQFEEIVMSSVMEASAKEGVLSDTLSKVIGDRLSATGSRMVLPGTIIPATKNRWSVTTQSNLLDAETPYTGDGGGSSRGGHGGLL